MRNYERVFAKSKGRTYVGLDVEILKVEGVLPDIDTNDGNVGQERVLVGCCDDLKLAIGWVYTLTVTIESVHRYTRDSPQSRQ